MAINFERGWINVVSEEVDEEGNHHVEFELAEEFVDWFMKREKIEEWDDQRFHKFMTEELPAIARQRREQQEKDVE
tara:strand:+ start:122 stop:349 length:228 start_codon:yes stop_codon:yes gene_type:complete